MIMDEMFAKKYTFCVKILISQVTTDKFDNGDNIDTRAAIITNTGITQWVKRDFQKLLEYINICIDDNFLTCVYRTEKMAFSN